MQISIVHIMTISGWKFCCKCGIVGGKIEWEIKNGMNWPLHSNMHHQV